MDDGGSGHVRGLKLMILKGRCVERPHDPRATPNPESGPGAGGVGGRALALALALALGLAHCLAAMGMRDDGSRGKERRSN